MAFVWELRLKLQSHFGKKQLFCSWAQCPESKAQPFDSPRPAFSRWKASKHRLLVVVRLSQISLRGSQRGQLRPTEPSVRSSRPRWLIGWRRWYEVWSEYSQLGDNLKSGRLTSLHSLKLALLAHLAICHLVEANSLTRRSDVEMN